MNLQRGCRILIAEDDPAWRQVLQDFYEEMLAQLSPAIKVTGRGAEAFDWVSHGKFDLLSLDINLGSTHPVGPDGRLNLRIGGADGRTVLRRARELKTCSAVVVITGLFHDSTVSEVVPNEEEREGLDSALEADLQEWFPGRFLLLHKKSGVTPKKCVEIWARRALSRDSLLRLLRRGLRPMRLEPPYRLDVNGTFPELTVYVVAEGKTRRGRLRKEQKIEGNYARMLYALCEAKRRELGPVGKAVLALSARGLDRQQLSGLVESGGVTDVAYDEVADLRRRLKDLGIDPGHLIKTRRNIGWELHPEVEIDGLGEPPIHQARGSGIDGHGDAVQDYAGSGVLDDGLEGGNDDDLESDECD